MSKFKDIEDNGVVIDEIDFDLEEYTEDVWAVELKSRLERAMTVWVASAYVDMRAVCMLENLLKNIPPSNNREIRFLLDDQFHENPLAREAIINRLYSLPNVKVRITDTKNKFHPKCYIFNQGSYTSCLVGSMNFTGGGLNENIELGIFSADPNHIKICRKFFINHWGEAEEAKKTERMDYPRQKYFKGDTVVYKILNVQGCVIKVKPNEDGTTYIYNVFLRNIPAAWVNESDLEKLQTFAIAPAQISNYKKCILDHSGFETFLYSYFYYRYLEPSEEGYYASINSRVKEVWYQKIPLYKIVNSSSPRLLIADEVGLGKTIEAGLIIKELLSRMPNCKKILILCPNNLTQKWQLEMRNKFGLFFEIHTGSSVMKFLNEIKGKQDSTSFNAIISYESLRKESLIMYLNNNRVNLDILVCDEAHHLRNRNLQQSAVRALAYNNRCMLMLTATPINLSNKDLRVLLGILDPKRYSFLDERSWDGFIIPNVYIIRLYISILEEIEKAVDGKVNISENVQKSNENLLKRIIKGKMYASLFGEEHPLYKVANYISEKVSKNDRLISLQKTYDIINDLGNSNVLSQSITRTLKKDVGEYPVRDVHTVQVTLKYQSEKDMFLKLVNYAKGIYKKNPAKKLVAHQILRQASSCLPVFKNEINSYTREDADSAPVKGGIAISPDILEQEDSKYDTLKEIILKARDGNDDYKLIIFCTFRKTIAYLNKKLEADFGAGVTVKVTGDVPTVEERYINIQKFAEPGKPNILLCSEVASEGIDLQFCHILINYDLPWNPVKLEQRIGRIDRFGQKADKINIFHVVVKGTVEEVIYSRLVNRLDNARNTLGPIAEVLGKIEGEIGDRFLDNKFNEDEKKLYIRNINISIDKAKKEQDKLDRESIRMITRRELIKKRFSGYSEGFSDNVENLSEFIINRNDKVFSITPRNQDYKIKLHTASQSFFLKVFSKYCVQRNIKPYYTYIKGKLASDQYYVVFDHDKSINSFADYLCIGHPIINYLIHSNKKYYNRNAIYYVNTTCPDLDAGKYIIYEWICPVHLGPKKYDFIFNRSGFKIDGDNIMELDSKNLKNIFKYKHWKPGGHTELNLEIIKKTESKAREYAEKEFKIKYDNIITQLEFEIVSRTTAYRELHQREIQSLEDKIQTTVDPNKKTLFKKEIDKIKKGFEDMIKDIPTKEEIMFSPELLFVSIIQRS